MATLTKIRYASCLALLHPLLLRKVRQSQFFSLVVERGPQQQVPQHGNLHKNQVCIGDVLEQIPSIQSIHIYTIPAESAKLPTCTHYIESRSTESWLNARFSSETIFAQGHVFSLVNIPPLTKLGTHVRIAGTNTIHSIPASWRLPGAPLPFAAVAFFAK